MKGHLAHAVLFVFAQNTNKFRFTANGMRTIRRQRGTGLQSHPHIRAFGLRTICEQFANHLARLRIRGLRFFLLLLWKNKKKMRILYYMNEYEKFLSNFLTFFQKLPSAYIFINCTHLWKFVINIFNTYLKFIKLSNTSTIFWKASIKFE